MNGEFFWMRSGFRCDCRWRLDEAAGLATAGTVIASSLLKPGEGPSHPTRGMIMKTETSSTEAIVERLQEAAQAIERSARRSGRASGRIYDNVAADSEAVISREWAALRRDLADLASNAELAAMPEVRKLLDQMKASVANASASVADAANDAKRRTVEKAESVDAFAHEAPWQTAGLAALAGIAIGLMIARR